MDQQKPNGSLLRMFVIGESSGDPDKWDRNGSAIVLARDEDEARRLPRDSWGEVHEVAISGPRLICVFPEDLGNPE